MIDIEEITMFNDMRERLLAVTDNQVEIAASRLNPAGEGEKSVGIIAPATRALWTLAMTLEAEILMETSHARSLIDDTRVRDHEERSMVAQQIKDIVLELMWAQSRSDTGYWAKGSSIGLRADWQLVEMKDSKSPNLGRLMAGLGLPSPE